MIIGVTTFIGLTGGLGGGGSIGGGVEIYPKLINRISERVGLCAAAIVVYGSGSIYFVYKIL